MAEEVKQPSFNLDNFIMGVDEGSGELTLGKKEPEVKAEEIAINEQVQPDDKFAAFEGRFNSILDAQNKQSNALAQVIQFLLTNNQNNNQQQLDQEQLGEVFQDADKGKAFLDAIIKRVESTIDSRFSQLQPVIQQNQVQNELNQVAALPDFQMYAPAMYEILGINNQLSFKQAYDMAKQKGWKSAPQKQVENKGEKDNVIDINQPRNLPNKLDSSNAQLKSKQVNSVRDALEAAYDELTGS